MVQPGVHRLEIPVGQIDEPGEFLGQVQEFPAEEDAPDGLGPFRLVPEDAYQVADVVDGGHRGFLLEA